MNCTPCQTALLKVGELLYALRKEELSPETEVLARQVAAMVHVTSRHMVDQLARKVLYEMPERDKVKEAKCGD